MNDRQLIADLLSALEYHTEQTRPIQFSKVAIEAAREYLRKPAQQQEPVAWLIAYEVCCGRKNRGSSLKKFDEVWAKCSFVSEDKDAEINASKWRNRKETPLYTSPQPSKPLTREQVREICEGSGYDKATMQERADFINGIRHAEATHGIKGDA